jgi:hypothetical protein
MTDHVETQKELKDYIESESRADDAADEGLFRGWEFSEEFIDEDEPATTSLTEVLECRFVKTKEKKES